MRQYTQPLRARVYTEEESTRKEDGDVEWHASDLVASLRARVHELEARVPRLVQLAADDDGGIDRGGVHER